MDSAIKQEVESNVFSELSRAKEIVRRCMEEDALCRNDDHWLMLKVWQKQGLCIMIDFQRWREMFSAETVRRVRQEIQSTHNGKAGELLPTDPDVLMLRKVKEDAIRAYYGKDSKVIQEYQVKRYGIK